MMRTLEGLCETFIVDMLKTVLEDRKHKVIFPICYLTMEIIKQQKTIEATNLLQIGKWYMDIRDWMEAMGVEQLRDWIQRQLAPTRLESIGQRAIEVLQVCVLEGSHLSRLSPADSSFCTFDFKNGVRLCLL